MFLLDLEDGTAISEDGRFFRRTADGRWAKTGMVVYEGDALLQDLFESGDGMKLEAARSFRDALVS